jgi:hypothetical protein
MEPVTPTKFKSNVLAALDFKPDLGDLNNYNPLPNRTKRKQTPGSPDPRQPKRATAGTRLNIPGVENDVCGCLASLIRDESYPTFILSFFRIAATARNGRLTEGSSSRVRYKLQ